MALLEIKNVGMAFGRLQAVANLSFNVNESEIHGLIGPNGAGKTTVFNLITGLYRPSSGSINFYGDNITGLEPHVIAKKGLTRSFQQTLLFMNQTVLANVLTGFHTSCRSGVLKEFFHTSAARDTDRACIDKSLEIIKFMGLEKEKNELACNLPHGRQKALGIGMALACNPKLLMLDEPVTGMNPTEIAVMMEKIREIRDRGLTLIIVEHSMKVVMSICDRITVISYGKKIAEGMPYEIQQNPAVIEAYLGREEN